MKYTFDNISLLKDGKRWFPIMGEIHYSRVPNKFWKDELLKMKAGGVDVVSAYTIWIHHEEIEGEYDWQGDKDLRKFIQTAKDCGLKVLLRIGPWCHGEVRNGGFPDWLLKKDFESRTNDERYFEYATKWYKVVFEQVKGLIANPENPSTENEPIIGVQIENEYGHCGGLYEKESGEAHMMRLQKIAKEIGFNVAIYTATGWGGAWTGGMLPVMGGYCDAPWDQDIKELEPSGNYTFTHERNDHNIGSDHGFGYGVTFDLEKFPYLTAELGGGLQVTQHRRTIATSKDIAAVANVKMGSGVNLLGFYMYHGGTNPEGKLTTLQESKATGYLNDLPIKSYDFRAPVREFGQVSDTLRELKLFSYFTQDFGEEFCTLAASIPEDNPLDPKNLTDLRYSFRTDGKKGYLFVNNYVRHHDLKEHKNIAFVSPDKNTIFPKIDIKNGDFFFLPFNIDYGNSKIKTATVTPLCVLQDSSTKLNIFYKRDSDSSTKNFFDFAKKSESEKFLVLSKKDALNLWKVQNKIFITDSDSYILSDKDEIKIISRKNKEFLVYPDFEKAPKGWKKTGIVNKNEDKTLTAVEFAKYEREDVISSVVEKSKLANADSSINNCHFDKLNDHTFKLDLSKELSSISSVISSPIEKSVSDCFVKIDYIGESAKLFAKVNGERKLILDNFWLGEDYKWEIGLKRFISSNIDLSSLELEINPLQKNAHIYIEKWPEINGDSRCELKSITCENEWSFEI